MVRLKEAVNSALTYSLKVKKGENVIIITDVNKRDVAYLFHSEARKLGAESLLIDMIPRKTDGEEPPPPIAKIMLEADVLICPTTKSLTHTDARRAASKKGARTITLPGVDVEMLARAGNVDYTAMREITTKLADVLTIGKIVRITSPAGTNLEMSIKGKKGIADTGLVSNNGDVCNLPAGEAFLAPVEGSTNGVLVVDGSIGETGIIKKPVKIYIKNGFATKILGTREARILRRQLAPFGKPGRNVAELGLGTNRKAKLTGKVLEDEKIFGTAHVALGNNISMGGTCNVSSHLDGIVLKPTVMIDERVILSGGKLNI